MLKKDLETRVALLEEENQKLTERWESFLADLKFSREKMAIDLATIDGSIQQCDLILEVLQEETPQ